MSSATPNAESGPQDLVKGLQKLVNEWQGRDSTAQRLTRHLRAAEEAQERHAQLRRQAPLGSRERLDHAEQAGEQEKLIERLEKQIPDQRSRDEERFRARKDQFLRDFFHVFGEAGPDKKSDSIPSELEKPTAQPQESAPETRHGSHLQESDAICREGREQDTAARQSREPSIHVPSPTTARRTAPVAPSQETTHGTKQTTSQSPKGLEGIGRKRPASPSHDSPNKRRDQDMDVLAPRRISFSQVYDNRRAPRTSTIFRYPQGTRARGPQRFYILQCPECDLQFNSRCPINRATEHALIQHGIPLTEESVVRKYGMHVYDCNLSWQRKHSRIPTNDSKPNPSKGRHAAVRRVATTQPEASSPSSLVRSRRPAKRGVGPVAGEVYLSYWDDADTEVRKLWIMLVLPLDDSMWDAFGFPESRNTIQKVGLDEALPESLVFSPSAHDDGAGQLQWTKDYQDGGPKADQRGYPVFCYDHNRLAKCTYEFVSAADLHPFDRDRARAENVEHMHHVEAYLRNPAQVVPGGKVTSSGKWVREEFDDWAEPRRTRARADEPDYHDARSNPGSAEDDNYAPSASSGRSPRVAPGRSRLNDESIYIDISD